jgi:hypothetical protein
VTVFHTEFVSGVHRVSQLCIMDMPERITRAAARAIKSFIGEVTFGVERKETDVACVKVTLNYQNFGSQQLKYYID